MKRNVRDNKGRYAKAHTDLTGVPYTAAIDQEGINMLKHDSAAVQAVQAQQGVFPDATLANNETPEVICPICEGQLWYNDKHPCIACGGDGYRDPELLKFPVQIRKSRNGGFVLSHGPDHLGATSTFRGAVISALEEGLKVQAVLPIKDHRAAIDCLKALRTAGDITGWVHVIRG